jgi:hypothetical protein
MICLRLTPGWRAKGNVSRDKRSGRSHSDSMSWLQRAGAKHDSRGAAGPPEEARTGAKDGFSDRTSQIKRHVSRGDGPP